MPHPALLKEMGMTPQEFGAITDNNERERLKEEAAQKVLARRQKEQDERTGIVRQDQFQQLVRRVAALERKGG